MTRDEIDRLKELVERLEKILKEYGAPVVVDQDAIEKADRYVKRRAAELRGMDAED